MAKGCWCTVHLKKADRSKKWEQTHGVGRVGGRRVAASLVVLPRLLDHLADAARVLALVFCVEPRGLAVGRARGVGVRQQRLDACEDARDVVDRAPQVLQDVQADAPVLVDCIESCEGF